MEELFLVPAALTVVAPAPWTIGQQAGGAVLLVACLAVLVLYVWLLLGKVFYDPL